VSFAQKTHFVCPLLHLRVSCSFCCGNWYRNMLNKHWITDFSISTSLYISPTLGQEKMNLLMYLHSLLWVHKVDP